MAYVTQNVALTQKKILWTLILLQKNRVLVGILEVLKISRWTRKMTPNQCLVPLTQWEFPAPPRPEVLLRPRHPLPSILLVGLLQVLPEKHQHAPPVVVAKPANW